MEVRFYNQVAQISEEERISLKIAGEYYLLSEQLGDAIKKELNNASLEKVKDFIKYLIYKEFIGIDQVVQLEIKILSEYFNIYSVGKRMLYTYHKGTINNCREFMKDRLLSHLENDVEVLLESLCYILTLYIMEFLEDFYEVLKVQTNDTYFKYNTKRIEKAENIAENLEDGIVSSEHLIKMMFQMIIEAPFIKEHYYLIYDILGSGEKELDILASQFNINLGLVEEIEQEKLYNQKEQEAHRAENQKYIQTFGLSKEELFTDLDLCTRVEGEKKKNYDETDPVFKITLEWAKEADKAELKYIESLLKVRSIKEFVQRCELEYRFNEDETFNEIGFTERCVVSKSFKNKLRFKKSYKEYGNFDMTKVTPLFLLEKRNLFSKIGIIVTDEGLYTTKGKILWNDVYKIDHTYEDLVINNEEFDLEISLDMYKTLKLLWYYIRTQNQYNVERDA